MDDGQPAFSLLGKRLAPAFERRVLVVAPGRSHLYQPAEWHDALVVLERGQIELLYRDGTRQRFEHGAVLWLDGLPLHMLHNPGPSPAVLVAVSRVKHPRMDAKGKPLT